MRREKENIEEINDKMWNKKWEINCLKGSVLGKKKNWRK